MVSAIENNTSLPVIVKKCFCVCKEVIKSLIH